MNTKQISSLIIVGLMWLILPHASQAYYGEVGLKALGPTNLKVGEDGTVKLVLEAGAMKMVGMHAEFGYDSNVVEVKQVAFNTAVFANSIKAEAGSGKVTLSALIPSDGTAISGEVEVASFVVTGKKEGSTNIGLTNYSFGGVNPAPAPTDPNAPGVDSALKVNYDGKLVTIVNASGNEGVLNFKMAFAGVTNKSKCATNWTVRAMVKDGSGNSKTYDNVPLELVSSDGEKNVYQGSVVLTGMANASGLSVFLKGPKHVQVKYAENGQDKLYNLDGGKLTVTKDPVSSVVYDFSKYEMGPGDVNQDGVVNAQDFVIVKNKSVTHQVVDDGTYLPEDLDANCIMNTNDVLLLRETLKEKQDQIY